MITTSTTITVEKVIRPGTTTMYSVDTISLFLKHNSEQKRFNATSVVNASTSSAGLITFTGVSLPTDGGYSFYITAESNVDLDINGVSLDRLATGYIKKITNEDTLSV